MMEGTASTRGNLGVGWRLTLMLCAQIALVVFVRSLPVAGVAAALVALAYAVARVDLRHAWKTLRGVIVIAALVGALQLFVLPWQRAALIAIIMVLAVALAALVTLTTSTTDLLDAIERGLQPLARLGVDPERVALTLALTARTIPVIAGFGSRLRDSGRARGARIGAVPYAVALVVLTLQHAERVGEALRARGVDD